MEPLAIALDVLQGDKYMSMGYLKPTIGMLIKKKTVNYLQQVFVKIWQKFV